MNKTLLESHLVSLLEACIKERGASAVHLIALHFGFDGFNYAHPHDKYDALRVAKKIHAFPILQHTLIELCDKDKNWEKWFFTICKQVKDLREEK